MSWTTSISFVAVEPLPLLHELLGDIDHARVIGRHRAVAERLQQMLCALLQFGSWYRR